MPEFNGDIFKAETEAATLKTIMHYQYASINKDSPDCAAAGTIYTQLQAEGIDPNEYIHFGALRAWQQATSARAVTELIYVHSKLMIVDDKYTIIGSANFNDRSQEGNRDSEMCILYTDDDEVDPENSFARTLRLKLWNRFINRDVSEESPTDVDFFNSWKETATSNSQKYEDVFRTAPNNTITNFAELGEYQGEQEPLNNSEDTFEEAIEKLQSIEGVLIDYPLEFLKDEWYHPDTFGGKEALAAPLGTFT